jgi:hypothetical protein
MSKLLLRELLQLIKISNYSLQSGTQMIVLPSSSIIMVLKTASSGARLFLVHQQLLPSSSIIMVFKTTCSGARPFLLHQQLLQHVLQNGMLRMILFLPTIAPVLS